MPTNTRQRPQSKMSVAKYVKNVGKSLALAGIDVTMENAPAMKEFLQSNDDYIKKGFAYIRNPRAMTDKADRQSTLSRVYQSVGTGLKNFKDDVLSGNLYNDAKAQQAAEEAFSREMGFDDFNTDDDFNFSEDSSSKTSPSGTSAVADSFGVAIGAAATSHATAVAQGTELVIGANKASTKLVIANMDKLGININAGLASVYANISITNKSIQTHVENSNKFYEATNNLLREQVALMRELVDMQRRIYAPQTKKGGSSSLRSAMDAHGNINLEGYIKNIQKNLNNNFGYLGINFGGKDSPDDMMNPVNLILNQLLHPSKELTKMFMRAITPKDFKNSVRSMDQALSSLFSQLIAAINKEKFKGGPLGALATIFGIGVDTKTNVKTSEYKKDAIPFDGITKQAIIETIPGYLARIEAALTGSGNARYYDYEQGRWTDHKTIAKEYKDARKRAVTSANFGIYSDTVGFVNKTTSSNAAAGAKLQRQIEGMMNQIYADGGYFRLDKINGMPAWQYYQFDSEKTFKAVAKNLSKETIRSLARKNMQSREDFSNRMRGKEGASAIERQLFNNAHGSVDMSISGGSAKSGLIKGTGLLSLSYDEQGKNVFYYLREILSKMDHRPAANARGGASGRQSRKRSKKTKSATSSASGSSDGDPDPEPPSEEDDDGLGDTIEQISKEMAEEAEKANRMNKVSKWFQDTLNKTPIGQFVNKFGVSFGKILASPINYMTKMLDKADKSLFKIMFGESELKDADGKPIDSVFSHIINKVSESFDSIKKSIETFFKDTVATKFKEWFKPMWDQYGAPIWNEVKSTVGKGFKRAKTAVGNTFGKAFTSAKQTVASKVARGDVVTADEVEALDKREMIQDNDDFYDNIVESAFGRIVTKRGLTMISPGEIIIPATSDRRKQNKMLAGERRDRSRIIRSLKSINGKIGLNAKGTVDMEKLKETLFNIYDENKPGVAKTAAGGILGAGAGLLTGVNPLLGAMAGAGISILNNSQTLQKIVFGEDTEDGHVGGIIPKKIQDYFKKAGGDAVDFGVAGGILGLVTGMGPLAGAAVGAGIGLLKNSETVNKVLFGEDGLIGKENKEKISKFIKKAAPNALIGAGIGILTGPFGLLGNAAVGAGLGLISSTDTFHKLMFGDKENDPDDQGIFGAFKEGMLNPAIEKMHELLEDMKDFTKKHIFDNLKKFFEPFQQMVKNAITNVGNGVKDFLNDMFERSVGIPIADWMREKLFKPMSKIMGGLIKLPITLGKAAINAPFAVLGWAGNNMRQRQIEKGTAYNMTAEERLQWRQDHNIRSGVGKFFGRDKMQDQDEILANMSIDDLQNLSSGASGLLKTREELGKDLGNARKDSRKAISKYFNDPKKKNAEGKTLYDVVGVKKIQQLTEMAANGDMAGFNKVLKTLSKKLTPQQMTELQGLVSSQITAVKTSMDAVANYDTDRDTKNAELSKLLGGRKIKGRKDMRQIMMAANAELKSRSKRDIEGYDSEEEVAEQAEADRQATITYRDDMRKRIDKILENLGIISESTQMMANPDEKPEVVAPPTPTAPDIIKDATAAISTAVSEGTSKALPPAKEEDHDEDSIEAKEAEEKAEESANIQKQIAENTKKTSEHTSGLFSKLFGKDKDKKEKKNGFFGKIGTAIGSFFNFFGIKGSTIAKIGLGAVALGTGVSLFGFATDWFKNKVWPTIKEALFGKQDASSGDYSGGLMSGLANKYNDIMYGDGTAENPGVINKFKLMIHGDGTEQNPGLANKIKLYLLGDGTETNPGLVGKLLNGGKALLFGEKGSFSNPTGGIIGWIKDGNLYKFIGEKIVPSLVGGFGLAMNYIVTPLTALIIKHFPSMLASLGKAILNGIKMAIFKNEITRDEDPSITADLKEFSGIATSAGTAIANNAGLDKSVTKIFSGTAGGSGIYSSASSSVGGIDLNSITDTNYVSAENTYDADGNHLNKTSTELMYKKAPGLAGLLGAKESTNTMIYDENGNIALRAYDQMNTTQSVGSTVANAAGRNFLYGAVGRGNHTISGALSKASTKGGKGVFGFGKKVFGTGAKATGGAANATYSAGSALNAYFNKQNDISNYVEEIIAASGKTGADAKKLRSELIQQIKRNGDDGIYNAIGEIASGTSSEVDDAIMKKAGKLSETLANGGVKAATKPTIASKVKDWFSGTKVGQAAGDIKDSFNKSKLGSLLNRKDSINDFAQAAAEAQGLSGRKAGKAAKKIAKNVKWNGASAIDDVLGGIDGTKISAEANESLLNKAINATDNVVKAPTISSKAKSKLVDAGTALKNSKAGQAVTTAVSNVADAAKNSKVGTKIAETASDAKGLIAKITSKLKGFFAELADNSTILGFFKKAAKSDVSENVLKKTIKELGEKVASSALGKAAGKALTKIAATAAKWVPFLNIAIYVADFLWGYNNADTLLGIAKGDEYKIGIGQKCICGLVHVLNNTFLLGLIPTDIIIDIFVDVLFPLFGLDAESLNAARDRADNVLDEWNKAHPEETYTNLEDFNNKDKWTTKAKKAISKGWDKIKTGVGNLWDKTKEGAKNLLDKGKTAVKNTVEKVKNSKVGQAVSNVVDKGKEWVSNTATKAKEMFTKAGTAVSEGVTKIADTALDIGTFVKDVTTNVIKYAIDSDNKWSIDDYIKPDDPLGGAKKIIYNVLKIPLGVIGVVTKVGSSVFNAIKGFVVDVKDGFGDAWQDIKAVGKGEYTVFSSEYWKFNDKDEGDNPLGIISKIGSTVLKVMSMPHAMLGYVGNKIWTGLKALVGGAKEGAMDASSDVRAVSSGQYTIFNKNYWKSNSEDPNNPLSTLGSIFSFVTRLFSAPTAMMGYAGSKIIQGIKNLIGGAKEGAIDASSDVQAVASGQYTIFNGNYWKSDNEDPNNPLSTLGSIFGFVTRLFSAPTAMMGYSTSKIIQGIKALISGAKEGAIDASADVAAVAKGQYTIFNGNYWKSNNEDPNNPLSTIGSIFGFVTRLFSAPTAMMGYAGSKIIQGIKALISGAKEGALDASADVEAVRKGEYTIFSADYWKSDAEDDGNPLSGIGSIFAFVTRLFQAPSAMLGYVGTKVKEGITALIEGATEGLLDASEDVAAVKKGEYTIFSKDYWKSNEDDGSNPLSTIGNIAGFITRLFQAPGAMLGWVGTKVSKIFTDMIGGVKDINKDTQDAIDKAKKGKISVFSDSYWKIKVDETNPLGGVGKVVGFIQRLFNAPVILIQKAFDGIVGAFGGVWDWFKGLFGGDRAGSGRAGTGRRGGARETPQADGEHIYQSNSAIANIRYGNSTIGEAGCAPVAATNLINSMNRTGHTANLAEAASFAERGGYTGNEGTDMRYFNTYLASKGIPTVNTSNKKTALEAIRSGRQVILLGQDKYNKNAPFGTNPHFITATGVAPNGDIIVEDPDLPDHRVYYKPNTLMKSMTSSVITGTPKEGSKRVNNWRRKARSIGGKSKARLGMRRALYGRGTQLGPQAVLNVARSQIGVKEHQPNVVKYNNAYWTSHNLGTSKNYNNSQDYYQWCCVFVWWCFNQAGASALFKGGSKAAVCSDAASWYKSRGKYDKNNPKPGDIVMFDYDNCGKEQHTGILESVEGDTYIVIEGNASDQVKRRTYKGLGSIKGFCHVDYPYEYDETSVVDMSKYGDTTDYKQIAMNGGSMTGDTYSAFVDGSPVSVGTNSGLADGSTATSSTGDTIFTKISNLASSVFKAKYGEAAYQMMFGNTGTTTTSTEDASIGTGPALTGANNSEKIWNYLRAHGYTAAGTAGLMGNLQAESSLNPNNLQQTYEKSLGHTDESYTNAVNNKSYSKDKFVNDSAGYGLAQWTYNSRKKNMYENLVEKGISIGDLGGQLQFLTSELGSSYPSIDSMLRTTTSVNDASDVILRDFERPANLNYDKRRQFSQNWYDQYKTASINDDMNYTTSVITSDADDTATVEPPTKEELIARRNKVLAVKENQLHMTAKGRGRKRVGDARTISRLGGYRTSGGATNALMSRSAYADGSRVVAVNTSSNTGIASGGVDYATFLNTILTVLMQIADNTTLLNSILDILSKNFNLNISKEDMAKAANSRARAQEALNRAVQESGGVSNMSNIINNRDTSYILQALQAIARE